jgi:hypothetical protein
MPGSSTRLQLAWAVAPWDKQLQPDSFSVDTRLGKTGFPSLCVPAFVLLIEWFVGSVLGWLDCCTARPWPEPVYSGLKSGVTLIGFTKLGKPDEDSFDYSKADVQPGRAAPR